MSGDYGWRARKRPKLPVGWVYVVLTLCSAVVWLCVISAIKSCTPIWRDAQEVTWHGAQVRHDKDVCLKSGRMAIVNNIRETVTCAEVQP